MFMKRDFRYGAPYYKFVGDSNSTELAAIFSDGESQRISKIFGTLKYWKITWVSQVVPGSSETIYVPQYTSTSIAISDTQIVEDFQTEFENCQWMVPFYFNSAEGNAAAVSRLNKLVVQTLDENEFKYRSLADTLGFQYDPLATLVEKHFGQDELARVYDDIVNLKEASGPITSIQYDNDGNVVSFVFDETRKIENSGIEASTTAKGYVSGASTSTTVIGENTITTTNSAPLNNGTTNQTKQYTTTYDDDEVGRLAGYTNDEGTVAQSGDHITKEDFPVVGRVQEGKQNPDFTDTKTYGSNKDGRNVPAQELIEAQRQLAKFSLEKEFFNDLKKKMLVAGWD